MQAAQVSKKSSMIADEDDPPLPLHNRTKRRHHDWNNLSAFQIRKDAETQVY